MIRVRVRQVHGVDMRAISSEQLKAKLRRRIDEQRSRVGLKKQSVPRAAIPHVTGSAHCTGAAHDGNPE
jgi:hypothetical protein